MVPTGLLPAALAGAGEGWHAAGGVREGVRGARTLAQSCFVFVRVPACVRALEGWGLSWRFGCVWPGWVACGACFSGAGATVTVPWDLCSAVFGAVH